MTGENDTPAKALERAVERVLTHDAFMHNDDAEIAEAVIEALRGEGWRIAGPEDRPEWADPLLDTLFTGKTLDFDGKQVPEWLQRRLEAEYGFPYPIAQRQPHPDEPGEPDDAPVIDPALLDLGIVRDPALGAPQLPPDTLLGEFPKAFVVDRDIDRPSGPEAR